MARPRARALAGLPGRGRTYVILFAAAFAASLPGLVLPFVIGDAPTEVATTGRRPVAPLTGTASDGAGAVADANESSAPVSPPTPLAVVGRRGGSQPNTTPGAAGSQVTGASGRTGSPGPPLKLGLLIIDLGAVDALGYATGIDAEAQRDAWQAFVDDVNTRGGVNGRPIEPVYQEYDVLSQDSALAACIALTEDAKVFAVIDGAGTYYGPPQLCVTEQHRTPFFGFSSAGTPREAYTRSRGLLFTALQAGDRMMVNFADQLDVHGDLRDRRVGILSDESDAATIDVLESEVGRRGGRVVHRSRFAADYSVAASQVPVEVNRMRTSRIDLVLVAANSLSYLQFVQEADSQGYRPAYRTSDWDTGSQDASAENMPASYEGSLSYAARRGAEGELVAGLPEAPVEAACRAAYERRGGRRTPPRDDLNYSLYAQMCSGLDTVVAGAIRAGNALTAESWSAAMQALGPVGLGAIGPSSFRQGKFDGADEVRTYRWTYSCRCWVPVGPFHPTRH